MPYGQNFGSDDPTYNSVEFRSIVVVAERGGNVLRSGVQFDPSMGAQFFLYANL